MLALRRVQWLHSADSQRVSALQMGSTPEESPEAVSVANMRRCHPLADEQGDAVYEPKSGPKDPVKNLGVAHGDLPCGLGLMVRAHGGMGGSSECINMSVVLRLKTNKQTQVPAPFHLPGQWDAARKLTQP